MDLRHLHISWRWQRPAISGQASERLQASQSTISQAIRALEGELDAALLERTTRLVSVMTAGAFLYSESAGGKPDLALIDLREEPWVAYDGDHLPLNEAATSALLGLVAAGLGVTLVPECARALPRQGVRFREVEGSGGHPRRQRLPRAPQLDALGSELKPPRRAASRRSSPILSR